MEEQSLSEFLEWEPESPESILDQGLMYTGTKTILYGRYKSMKSMLVQHLMLAVASGEPWLGFNTPAEGASVFYLQAEIPHRLLHKRIKKMIGKEGLHTKQPVYIWTEPAIKLDQTVGLARLMKKVEKYNPGVLIIDPIYKMLTGDMKEQSQISTFLDNMDQIISRHGTTLLLVAHSKKGERDENEWGSDDLLGSVFFSAWPDSIIQIERSAQLLTVKFDVVRHAEEDISPVQVMVDRDKLQFNPTIISMK